jgi:hypothetical protein
VLKRKKPQESSQVSGVSYNQAALSWKYSEGKLKFKRVLRVGITVFPQQATPGKP